MPDEQRFDQGFWASPYSAAATGTPRVGTQPVFGIKSEMKDLLSDLTKVDAGVKQLTKSVESLSSAFEKAGRAAQGVSGGGSQPSGGTISRPSFSGRVVSSANNLLARMPGALGARFSGGGGGRSTITAGSISGGPAPKGNGGSGNDPTLDWFAVSSAGQALSSRVGGALQATTTPGVTADWMARQFALFNGQPPSLANNALVRRNFNQIKNAYGSYSFGAQDVAQGIGTLQNQLGRTNQAQMLQIIRNAGNINALMPGGGFAGAASVEANIGTANLLTNRLGAMGAGLIGRGGRVGNISTALRQIGLYAEYGNPNANVSARQAGRDASLLSGQNSGAQILERFGLSPETIQAVQQYMLYSRSVGRYINLNSKKDLTQAGVTASYQSNFATLATRTGNQQMSTGLAGESTQETINSLQGELQNLIGNVSGSPAGGTLAGFGLALGQATKSVAGLASLYAEFKILTTGLGLASGGGILSKLLKGAGPAAAETTAAATASTVTAGEVAGGAGLVVGAGAALDTAGATLAPIIGKSVANQLHRWGVPKVNHNSKSGWVSASQLGKNLWQWGKDAWHTKIGDAGYWRGVGDGPLSGPGHTSGMQGQFLSGLEKMFAANPSLVINSGYRSSAEQAKLYAAYKSGKGNLAAPPGHSMHEQGLAADIGPPSQYGWLAANARKFGLYVPMPSQEPWHLQPLGVQGTNAVEPAPTTTAANVSGGAVAGVGFMYGNKFGSTDVGTMLASILAAPGGPAGGGGRGMPSPGTASTSTGASSSGVTPGGSAVQSILAGSKDPHVRLAMLMGSSLESNLNAGAIQPNGMGRGMFQIDLGAHPGVTQAQALSAGFSVNYMLPSYIQAVRRVPAALWKTDPAKAGEMAAFYAERPAADYYASQGAGRVNSAYSSAMAAMGDPPGGGGVTMRRTAVSGGRVINQHFYLYVMQASEEEAKRFAQMAMTMIRQEEALDRVGAH